jgi:hypothetical protein
MLVYVSWLETCYVALLKSNKQAFSPGIFYNPVFITICCYKKFWKKMKIQAKKAKFVQTMCTTAQSQLFIDDKLSLCYRSTYIYVHGICL